LAEENLRENNTKYNIIAGKTKIKNKNKSKTLDKIYISRYNKIKVKDEEPIKR
jgi:hypothetical protein